MQSGFLIEEIDGSPFSEVGLELFHGKHIHQIEDQHLHSDSYIKITSEAIVREQENEKMKKYNDTCLDQNRCFTPFI